MSSDTDFMSRKETNKLILMGVVLLLLVLYLVQGTFQPSVDDSGVPGVDVRQEGSTDSRMPPSPEGPGLNYEPPIPTVSPSQDAQSALETLRAYEENRTGENVATVSSADWVYDPKLLATAGDLELDLVDEPALYHLLARLNYMTEEQVERAPAEVGSFTWEDLRPPTGFVRSANDFSHLDPVRGKFISLKGRFLTHLSQRVLVDYPNEAGLAWVWQGTFMAGNKGYFVLIVDKEFDPKIGPYGQAIALNGAFLKLYSFQPLNKDLSVKSYPLLVAKSFKLVPPQPKWDYMVDVKLWVGIAIIMVFVLMTYVYAVASRQGAGRIATWRHGRFTRRARRELKEGLAKVEAKEAAEAPDAAAPAEAPDAAAPAEAPDAAAPAEAPDAAAPAEAPDAAPPTEAPTAEPDPPPETGSA